MATSPLEQFMIKDLIHIDIGGYDLSFTQSSLVMLVAVACTTLLMTLGVKNRQLVPGRLQNVPEMLYEFVAGVVNDNLHEEGKKYFPFVFSIFMFVFFCNLLGLLPGGFTVTSQIIVTFAMAMVVFVIVTAIGFIRHGLHFFRFFVPAGVPWPILPILVPIEVMSYFIRPVTLSVRLFANMVAGHVMLALFGGFVIALWSFYYVPAVFPFLAIIAVLALELLIAALQAYVFAMLTCIYLNDAVHMSH